MKNFKLKSMIALMGLMVSMLTPAFNASASDYVRFCYNDELGLSVNLKNIEDVRNFCEQHPDLIDAHDQSGDDSLGWSPLIMAIYNNCADTAKCLIEYGADVNAKEMWSERTPLMIALECGNIQVARCLIERGANVNAVDDRGDTPLHSAKNIEMVKCLVEYGANVDAKGYKSKTPLMLAVSRGDVDTVSYLLEHGANINDVDDRGNTLLHSAKNIEMVKCLVERGVNVNLKNNDGNTPLHYAKNVETIKCLVENGADVNAKNFWGRTPLNINDGWDEDKLNLDIIKYLVKNGADINAQDIWGNTILMCAVIHEDLEITKYLVENGADVNSKRYDGKTALLYAVERGNFDIVKCLTEHEADVTDASLLCCTKNLTIHKYLVEHGAEIDCGIIGNFILNTLREMDLDVLEYLVELGTDINVKDERGHTLLRKALDDLYAYCCNPYIGGDHRDTAMKTAKAKVEFLRSKGAKE